MKDVQNIKKMYSIKIQDERVNKLLEHVISYNKPVPVEINGIKVFISSENQDQLEETDKLELKDAVDENFDRARANISEAFKDIPEDEILANLDRIRKELRDNNSTD